MAIAAAEPSPAAVMTWARGLATFPATQTPGTVVRPVASLDDPIAVEFTAELDEQVVVRYESGWDEQDVTGNDLAIVEFDADKVVVFHHDVRWRTLDDVDPSGDQFDALLISQRARRDEGDDVVGPLPNDVCVLHGLG